MKLRDQKDIKNKAQEELRKSLVDAKKDLFSMQMDIKMGKLKNTRSLFWKRKEIAYLLTELRRKELAQHG